MALAEQKRGEGIGQAKTSHFLKASPSALCAGLKHHLVRATAPQHAGGRKASVGASVKLEFAIVGGALGGVRASVFCGPNAFKRKMVQARTPQRLGSK